MCEPSTIIMAVGAVVSLAASMKASSDQQEHQNNLQIQRQQQIEVNQILANRAAAKEQEQINQQVVENQIAENQQLQENSTAALQASASARVATGEAGVGGVSVAALLHDFKAKEGRFADSVKQNSEGFAYNAEARKEGAEAKRQGRVASIQPYVPAPVQQPNYAGALVSIAGGLNDAGYFDSASASGGSTWYGSGQGTGLYGSQYGSPYGGNFGGV